MRTNIPPNSMGQIEAQKQVAALKLNPQDYGFSSWTTQALANALNITIRGSVNKSKILAYPGGSTDYVTGKLLTKEQTEQKANTYNKDSAIAEVKALGTKVYNALYSPFYSTALTPLGRQETEKATKAEIQQVYERVKNFVSQTEFNSYFNSSLQIENTNQLARYQELHKPDFLSTAIPLVTSLGAGFVTGGLPLTQQLAVNSAISLAQGAKPEDVLKSALGTIAANEVPGFLKELNNQIPNDALYAGIVNAERQAVYALATGQDPKQAALAGFAGGATAGYLASDNAAIGRATGEYIQALAAGRSQTDAMMAALGGFAQEEYAEAQKKILAEKQARDEGRTTIASDTATTPTTAPTGAVAGGAAAPTTGATGGTAALPEVTVTGTAPASTAGTNLSLLPSGQTKAPTTSSALPTVTVTGTPDNIASANLSLQSTATTTPEKTPEKVKTPEERAADTMLLSLLQPRTIFGPGGARSDPTRTSSTVGSQALAQALRVGDLGAPIFGRKEEGRRAGWNVESLRYMGNSEG